MHIPLDTAHKILATFGITKPTREYERWVKPDGFEDDDFWQVLSESKFVFDLDWRGVLAGELDRIASALNQLEVEISVDAAEDGQTATVTSAGNSVDLAYSPNNPQANWLAVIQGLQSIVPGNIEFREAAHNDGSDTFVCAVLPDDEWQDLDDHAPEILAELFRALPV